MPKYINMNEIAKSEQYWRDILTPLQFEITRLKRTEAPFTGALLDENREGVYLCVCCGAELFTSDLKFNSHCGWPSFFDEAKGAGIQKSLDHSFGMTRIEITCEKCGSHLGHVFDDGPNPTNLRYCVNSASLRFEPK